MAIFLGVGRTGKKMAVPNYYYGSTENPIAWKVTKFEEKVFQAYPGAPVQAGGCCEKCSQSIRYVVTLASSDGRVMAVGRDCAVTLQGGPDLAEIRSAEAAWEREQYLASPEYAALKARKAAEEAALKAGAARAESEHACLLFALRAIVKAPASSKFEAAMASREEGRIVAGYEPDVDERDAGTLAVAFAKASLPASKHVGEVGKRIEKRALFEAMIPIDTPYGRTYIRKFRTVDGEALVWFSSSYPDGLGGENLGDWVKIRATVKAHKDYNGEPQTSLLRLKVVAA
jgi:hypothetical protein